MVVYLARVMNFVIELSQIWSIIENAVELIFFERKKYGGFG